LVADASQLTRTSPFAAVDARLAVEPLEAGTAVRTRHGLAGAIGWLAGSAERAGLRTGPVGSWAEANKRALRVAAVLVAALALVFWGRPTGKVVIGLTLALLAALALIELFARPGTRKDAVSTPT
jgi:hypothetical protein